MKQMKSVKERIGFAVFKLRRRLEECLNDQGGFGTVEIVLLLLVLVGLVLIFKDKVRALVNSIFSKITSAAGKV